MARTQTIVEAVTCDLCPEDGVRTFTILIDDGMKQRSRPRVMDACEEHATAIVDLQLAVRRAGVILTDDADALPRTACPLCAREFGRSDVYAHLRSSHGLKAPPQPAKCPDCKQAMGATQMIRHRAGSHGYDYLADYIAHASKGRKAR